MQPCNSLDSFTLIIPTRHVETQAICAAANLCRSAAKPQTLPKRGMKYGALLVQLALMFPWFPRAAWEPRPSALR